MEIDINSDEHKISNNKLRYYFDDITKFENNKVALMECMGGGGSNPIFAHGKMCVFPFFSHGEKWGKQYMEREGNEYFSLSFHILFSHFSMGKNGVGPPQCMFRTYFQNIKSNYSMRVKYDGGFYNINFIDSQLEIFDINDILQDHLIKFNLQTEDETPKIQITSDVNTYSALIFIEKGFELHLDNNFQRILGYDYPILKNVMQRSNVTPKVNKLNYIKISLNIVDNKLQ